jgi:hypothetical protein
MEVLREVAESPLYFIWELLNIFDSKFIFYYVIEDHSFLYKAQRADDQKLYEWWFSPYTVKRRNTYP